MIYLLPYEFDGELYQRKELGTGKIFANIWMSYDKKWNTSPARLPQGDKCKHNSFEDAAKFLDNYLLFFEYYLIPDDQVERFKKKLAVLI